MGLRVECIKMEEQLSLLENPSLKVLLLEDKRSDWVNPIFDEREKCGEFHTLFPMLLEQAQQFFQNFRMWPDTFWYILHNIKPHIQGAAERTPRFGRGIASGGEHVQWWGARRRTAVEPLLLRSL